MCTVVVDRREDRDCDLGGFELAYKQVPPPRILPTHTHTHTQDQTRHPHTYTHSQSKLDCPSYIGIELCVRGAALQKPRPPNPHWPPRKTLSATSWSPDHQKNTCTEKLPLTESCRHAKDDRVECPLKKMTANSPATSDKLAIVSQAKAHANRAGHGAKPHSPTAKLTMYNVGCAGNRTQSPPKTVERKLLHRTSTPVRQLFINTSPGREAGSLMVCGSRQSGDTPGN